jgi:hypothetical protein
MENKNGADSPAKKKGLTVFETILDENFLVSTKHATLPKTGPPILADEFSICLTSKRDKLNKYYCELRDNYIFVKKDKNKEPTAFMDINYSRIKLILDDNINGEIIHCIKFIKLRSYEEIFSPDYDKIMKWFEKLKSCCVLSRFREYFSSIKVLGKGNFAKVTYYLFSELFFKDSKNSAQIKMKHNFPIIGNLFCIDAPLTHTLGLYG